MWGDASVHKLKPELGHKSRGAVLQTVDHATTSMLERPAYARKPTISMLPGIPVDTKAAADAKAAQVGSKSCMQYGICPHMHE